MIGSSADALYIRDWHIRTNFRNSAPEGWTRLGSGCYRVAYLSPDGVVYKVEHSYGSGYSQSNFAEWRNYNRLRLTCKLPTGARFPRMSHHALDGDGVNAMEHFPRLLCQFPAGDSLQNSRYWNVRTLIERATQLWDMHGANLAVDEETKEVIPIDLGG